MLLNEDRPAVVRAQVTRDTREYAATVDDRRLDEQSNLGGWFHFALDSQLFAEIQLGTKILSRTPAL